MSFHQQRQSTPSLVWMTRATWFHSEGAGGLSLDSFAHAKSVNINGGMKIEQRGLLQFTICSPNVVLIRKFQGLGQSSRVYETRGGWFYSIVIGFSMEACRSIVQPNYPAVGAFSLMEQCGSQCIRFERFCSQGGLLTRDSGQACCCKLACKG
ncbi:hypothetical protein PGTUg99_031097 [Puccinia graminis f. sp. tritici]|uniref:Uncharacterized protein n=1 Tax=Puccinia graminis f. sp. tritici TaxID=56615 RepID=A0A5B0LWS4_PUCGR|nr:hypothetical protein PGTUg99_031097 [Puccinia graminis f. sp. tritici]